MSFSGVSDIVKGVELAIKLYDYGFTYENRADVRYANFRREVLEFKELLDKLNAALKEAQQRWEKKALSGIRPLERDFENERKTIVGDFHKTLKECDALLQKNKHFRDRDSHVLENLQYNLGQQEIKADVLRRRLHFHSLKIRLVIDRLSVNMLTDLDDKVDDILAISEQNLQVSQEIRLELARFYASWLGYVSGQGAPQIPASQDAFAVSEVIARKFEQSMHADGDANAQIDVPLIKGFDSLLEHFEESREDGSSQTHRGYLLFLKSRWLLERILESEEYKNARPGYYYRRAVNQVQQAILTRMASSTRLISYPDETLLQLPDSDFCVWPVPVLSEDVQYRKPDPIMVRGGEEKLCSMDLASSSPEDVESLTAIKSSEERLRIVHESGSQAARGRVVVTQHELIVTEDRLIPRYAFPTLVEPCLELAIFCRNAEYFDFKSIEDVHRLQGALMGFQVAHEESRVRCQFSDEELACKGFSRVQLWQEPIVLPTAPSQVGSDRSQAHGSHSARLSLTQSITAPSTVHAIGEGFESERAKSSCIVIFTQLVEKSKRGKERKSFAAFAVDLDNDIYIDPTSCPCHRDPGCTIIALRARKDSRSSFNVRYVSSETDSEGQPDPITFNILPLRTPSHPRSRNKVSIKSTEYVMLIFPDLASKNLFIEELYLRFAVRDQQIRDQKIFEQSMRFRQEHPMSVQQYPGRNNRSGQKSPTQVPQSRTSSFAIPPGKDSQQHRSSVATGLSFASASSDRSGRVSSISTAIDLSVQPSQDQIKPVEPATSHRERSDSGYESRNKEVMLSSSAAMRESAPAPGKEQQAGRQKSSSWRKLKSTMRQL
ncbi:hypothetical protein CKM354_000334100 [Cercospora kikuchii]|uniref:Uncharacterized protein n=1 Tax=Cercospora kikuchii TaxID=84275 RepID=A0A9P3CEM8_9PEZI|nr:uncharacterized protein CKM354_000334100 [Cercospora kikuchii]GIZ39982.1 hypothetical protein CKM354_000334100 [Cercospora kikuchii]